MPTLTIKNIPDALYSRLKETAQAHHRSLNGEILYCVERALGSHKMDTDEILATATRLRAKTANHPMTDDDMNVAKNEGRP